ncbi:hypothetical protein [Aromatoleum aromaticum]|uniref:hypothetical protein n=1 Tax=Aromatoleum aromaticum TaxID=551760 RepID=UPI001459EB6F|nr:hypothetical protein [Aromatoleum aromaticum]NMG55951.1 hypothetical protein [Aromatoleum aromaticum]
MKISPLLAIFLPLAASAQGYLENPQPGANESGISLVSGWHCSASEVTVFIDGVSLGKSGVGSIRNDTVDICGHAGTGFSLLYNYNIPEPGVHEISVFADGALMERRTFNTVRSGGTPFLSGATKTIQVENFPSVGQAAILEWSQAKQSFVVTNIEGGDGASGPNTAEGMWTGVSEDNRRMTGFVLDDGAYYVFYTLSNNHSFMGGVVQGSGNSANGTFSSTNLRDFSLEELDVFSGSFSASYDPQNTMTGTGSYSNGAQSKFSATYSTAWETPSSLAGIAGHYAGSVATEFGIEGATVRISSSGLIAAAASGCQLSGNLTPRSRGNVFNMTLKFGSSPCAYAGQTFRGIATLAGSSDTLVAAALNGARTEGVMFIGQK